MVSHIDLKKVVIATDDWTGKNEAITVELWLVRDADPDAHADLQTISHCEPRALPPLPWSLA